MTPPSSLSLAHDAALISLTHLQREVGEEPFQSSRQTIEKRTERGIEGQRKGGRAGRENPSIKQNVDLISTFVKNH
jgi:hypothetical protein